MVKKSISKMITQTGLFYIKKNVSLMSLIVLALVLGVLFSSCGFVGLGGGSTFSDEDSTDKGNPGDGDTPSLSRRFETEPELADEDCKGNDRCEDVCEKMYDDSDHEDTCKLLTIGQVAKIEDVFYALISGDLDKLEDIDKDDLEEFLAIGLDGWKIRVIDEQKIESDRDTIFLTILQWIVDQENMVISALESEDRNSEILKEIFLAYCDINNSGGCRDGNPAGSGVYRNGGGIYYNSLQVAYIEDIDDRYFLFEALGYAGVEFFERAAENRRYDAFAAGNKILEKVCIHVNDRSVDQCIRAFYCWLQDETTEVNYQDRVFNRDEIIESIGREIQLNCSGLQDITVQ